MGYLVFIGVIIVVLLISLYTTHDKRNRRLSQPNSNNQASFANRNRQSSQASTPQIDWNDNNHNNNNNDIINQLSWTELETESIVKDDFFNPNTPDDLDNILSNVIGAKDPYTQEKFKPGQKVYLCRLHRLAYREDTWSEIGCKCMCCGNSAHTALYVLPNVVRIGRSS